MESETMKYKLLAISRDYHGGTAYLIEDEDWYYYVPPADDDLLLNGVYPTPALEDATRFRYNWVTDNGATPPEVTARIEEAKTDPYFETITERKRKIYGEKEAPLF